MDPSPPALPPSVPASLAQGIRDEEHLRMLAICHYIVGGFTVLFASFFILHVAMGLMIVSGNFPMNPPPVRYPAARAAAPEPSVTPFSPDGNAPRRDEPFTPDRANRPSPMPPEFPRAMGYLFAAMGAAVVLLGWTVGGLTIYSGRCLQRRRHRMFTFVMAGVNCLHIPFGTALGVFTFVVLQRPSVAALYLSRPAGQPLAANV